MNKARIGSVGMRRYRLSDGKLPSKEESPLVEHYRKEKVLDLEDDTPLELPVCDKDDPACESCQ